MDAAAVTGYRFVLRWPHGVFDLRASLGRFKNF
jgi:hypothetical protein